MKPPKLCPRELRKIVGLPKNAPDSDLIETLACIITAQKRAMERELDSYSKNTPT